MTQQINEFKNVANYLHIMQRALINIVSFYFDIVFGEKS